MSRKYIIFNLCLVFLLAFTLSAYAQNTRTVTGTVVDDLGEPIIGAAIKVVDSPVGTVNSVFPFRKAPNCLFHLSDTSLRR